MARSPSLSVFWLAACVTLLSLACADSASTSAGTSSNTPDDTSAAAPGASPSGAADTSSNTSQQAEPAVGRGFVVWESSRGGRWRIWRRDLDGSEPRALTPDEPGRAHCCAHVSPDGRHLVYLSLPQAQTDYPKNGAAGELRLLDLESGTTRELVSKARTYFEHRAVVWHDDETLVYIDADGRTVRLHLIGDGSEDQTEVLLDETRPAHGWLVDRTLSFATQGTPTFSLFDEGNIRERSNLGGCQPYFAHHRPLGVWVAGAGGPIRAIDLASRRQWPLLAKSDARLPGDRRYLYFPMPSPDGRLLAWAASSGSDQHDHTKSDYDVFVAETDPETLELLGTPWRVTYNQATDRFPDVWSEPLELGRHAGEAPFEATLTVPEDASGDDWSWALGDGREASGRTLNATWEGPGRYAIVARGRDGTELHGAVHVTHAAPPVVVEAVIQRGQDDSSPQEVRVLFDEPVDVESARASLQRGGELSPIGLRDHDRVWVLRLAKPLDQPDRLTVRGVADRAQTPNVLETSTVVVTPPRWPSRRDGLVFLWQTKGYANRVVDPATGREEPTLLEPFGRAWTDRHGAAVLRGGSYQPKQISTMRRLLDGVKSTNEISLEMTFTADRAETTRPSALFGFGTGGSRRNVTVAQEGDRLTLRLNTPSSGQGGDRPVVDLGRVRAGKPQHLVVTYTPGRLRAYLDGRQTVDTDALRSGFFHWEPRYLRLGAEGPGADGTGGWTWTGRLEGIAVWNRELPEAEAKDNHRRYAEILRERTSVTSPRVLAELVSRTRTPVLSEIAPYREAVVVFEYRVQRVLAGPVDSDVLRVVHRVLYDGKEMPIASMRKGQTVELELEPYDAQSQLDELYFRDDLPPDPSATLWWSDRIEP